jgi:hypothetical protein
MKVHLPAIILGALLFFYMWVVNPAIYSGASIEPNEATGQIWSLNDRGKTVFITEKEKLLRDVLYPLLLFATAIAFLISYLATKGEKNNSGGQ